MTFRATQRPNWAGGIFCLIMTGALIVLGLYLLSRLTSRDPPLARLMGVAPFAIALVSLGVAGTLTYDSLYPKVLTLDAESIRLSRGQKVIGQVPFANVVTVGVDWARPKTQGGLIGQAVNRALYPKAKLAAGVRIRLRDSAAAATRWPAGWFDRGSREARIGWRIDCAYQRLAQELEARLAAYSKKQAAPPDR